VTEREFLFTGVGGQGVQLAAQVIARAATIEGRHVLFFGVYSGMMRGGNSDSTVVISDAPVLSPPIVSSAGSALALHSEFWAPIAPRVREGGTVVVNSSVFDAPIDRGRWRVIDVPATDIATDLGNSQAVSMVAAAAFARVTEAAGLEALIAGMRDALPPYRAQHAPANERALRAGWEQAA